LENFGPAVQALPAHLAARNYKNPDSLTDCPFNTGFATLLPAFKYVQNAPKRFEQFHKR
jgi:hypothetical protein